MKKIKVDTSVRINAYGIVSDQLEYSIQAGVRKAYKHNENPSEETISSYVHDYVMLTISELLIFD